MFISHEAAVKCIEEETAEAIASSGEEPEADHFNHCARCRLVLYNPVKFVIENSARPDCTCRTQEWNSPSLHKRWGPVVSRAPDKE